MTRTRPIERVLVANRGEIAVRVLRTVQGLGMHGILVHHALDRLSPGFTLADEAIEIHGASPVAAYLDGEAIIAAARAARADAIHPGYGFLSENADFARAVEQAGMIFIGPAPDTIELLGDKIRARAFVQAHGFPVAPSAIEDDDPASFVERVRALGPPLLIKPAAGGGGKGMRIVRDLVLLDEGLERARSESLRYFGDSRLYAERYIERPRHIEVQILGDAHGNVIHLFERECSMQRRFQKIIEEAPAAALGEDVRSRICEVAAAIGRTAGYRSAGTVEFIYSAGEFYFLEVNTRLQVEHPVTEMTVGVDLVAEQLRIAAGEPLSLRQDEIRIDGHAIEMRIYAEDAARSFIPTTGPVILLDVPEGPGIRFDGGIRAGQAVTASFDPLLGKLIVHAAGRAEAIVKALDALERFVLLGCRTNVEFLARLIRTPEFGAGDLHTGLIDALPAIAVDPAPTPDELRLLLCAAAVSTRPVVEAAKAVPRLHAELGAWRN
jgi:acetyl/propionyl-CoA carboxylase alpha subunit